MIRSALVSAAALALMFLVALAAPSPPTPTAVGGDPTWWQTEYATRMRVTVSGGIGGAAAGEVVAIPAGPGDGARRDWRLVRWDGSGWQELPRATVADRTWFRLVAPVAPHGIDDNYWLYTNNPTEATQPPSEGVLRFLDDFNGDLSQWQPHPADARATIDDGVLRLSAPAPSGEPNNYLTSRARFGPGTLVEIKARSVSYTGDSQGRYGHDVDFGFANRPLEGDARWRLENFPVWQMLVDPGPGTGAAPRATAPGDSRWRLFQIARYPAGDGRVVFWLDDGPTQGVESPPLTPSGSLALMLRAFDNVRPPAGEPERGIHAEVDWVALFDVGARRPATATVGPPEGESAALRVTFDLPPAIAGGPLPARVTLRDEAGTLLQRHHLNLDNANSLTLGALRPLSYTLDVAVTPDRCARLVASVASKTLATVSAVDAPRADLDSDGRSTVTDQALIAAAVGTTIHTQPFDARADLTRDGRVDAADLDLFAHDWRQGVPCGE